MPPEQKINSPLSPEVSDLPIQTNEPKRNSWFNFLLIVSVILIVSALGFLAKNHTKEENLASNPEVGSLETAGSTEYQQYIKSIDNIEKLWLESKAQMETDGSTEEEIKLAHYDFVEFFVSTLVLKIKFESESNLTDTEKRKIAERLVELATSVPTKAEIEKICRQTEKSLPIPSDLQSATFTLENDAYLAIGKEKENCSPSLGNVELELVSNYMISTFRREEFEKEGRILENISAGKKLTLEKIISVYSNRMFSEGPTYHLIFKDEQGKFYQVATVFLDNKHEYEDRIKLSYSKNGKKLGTLNWEYFKDYQEQYPSSILIIFKSGVPETEVISFKDLLQNQSWAKSIEYLSGEVALERFKKNNSNKPDALSALNELGENPIGSSLNLYLKDQTQGQIVTTFIKSHQIYSKIEDLNIEE